MNGHLNMRFLGAPEIHIDGQSNILFAHRKSLALLCYLAVTGKPHSRAQLAGLLWGEATEANARASLRKSLAELRRLVGSNLLISRHEIAFNRASGYSLDIEQFDREAQAVKNSQVDGLSPTSAAAAGKSAALYRGDFLAGFHVLRAQAFEEWILLERERLRLAALRMLYTLAVHALTQAQYAEAVDYAEQVLALEPCHEQARRLLMSLLALSGQQTAALRQYQIYRQVMADELGLEPDDETTALYERIRDSSDTEEEAELERRPVQRPPTSLIGRRHELDDILARLRDPGCRLLTMIGPGGCGKSHLAREIATAYPLQTGAVAGEPPKVFLISLASSASIESLTPTLAQGTGFYFSQESEPWRQLLSYLRHQHALLILDGCEALLDLHEPGLGSFVDLVTDILTTAPGITILATSRIRLHHPSEFLFPLAGMAYPQLMPDNANDLYAYDAVQLFLWQLRRVQPDLAPSAEDLLAIGRICRFAMGLPLEILLLANWARLQAPALIAAQLTGAITHRADGEGNGRGMGSLTSDLQRSLAPIFDHSWNLLTAVEQRTLATLSIFSGGFMYQAAHEVCGVSMRGLMALQDQSLLSRTEPAGTAGSAWPQAARYIIHDLLQDLISKKALLRSEREDAREKVAAYFMAQLSSWAAGLEDGREQETLAQMDSESVNMRAAWEWVVDQGRFDLIDQGVDGLCHFYRRRFRYHEGESACRTAVQSLTATTPDQRRVLAKVQAWQSWFTADHAQAAALLQDSQAALDQLAAAGEEVRAERAQVLFMIGRRLLATDHALSKPPLEESLQLYQALDEAWHAATIMAYLHIQSWKAGAYEEGSEIAETCLALYREIGCMSGYAAVLGDRGIGALQAGLVAEGSRWIEESVAILEELGDQVGIVRGLYLSGMAFGFNGRWEKAGRQLQAAVTLGENRCDFIDTILIALAIVDTHRGRYAEARDNALAGLELARALDNQMCIGRALTALALTSLGEGEAQQAEELAGEAVTVYTAFGQKTELGMALAAQGYAACRLGNPAAAQPLFNEALSLASAHKDQMALAYAFPGVAYLLSFVGEEAQAIENYALAAQHPIIGKSAWFAGVAGRRIDEAAAGLPREIADAARERGQAHDLGAITRALMS